ncbi:MAG: HIT domain-containing protein [Luminiphilus sp.]|jgi:diadenosine tetraphosphate (Ap4A) HIT family hydrolase
MFKLDPQLEADTFLVGMTPLSRILLMNDCRYPWLILVPERPGITEAFELGEEDQRRLWQESMVLGEVMKTCFSAHKLNIATLGNQVSQLHVHHIARFRTDPAWPRPIWGVGAAEPYTPDAALERVSSMREALSQQFALKPLP